MVFGMDAQDSKRRKYVGVGGDDVPSLGVLEGDILRLLWDAGEGQSSVQVYDLMKWGPTSANSSPGRIVFLRTPEASKQMAVLLIQLGILLTGCNQHPQAGFGVLHVTALRQQVGEMCPRRGIIGLERRGTACEVRAKGCRKGVAVDQFGGHEMRLG